MDKLQNLLQEVISIQPSYGNFATHQQKERNSSPEMIRRRDLVINSGPENIKEYINQKSIAQNSPFKEWSCVGSNGVTNSAEIPWMRIFVEKYSDSPQRGFYLTLLFNALGSGVYLTLNQGSTKGKDSFSKLDPEIVDQRVNWAKKIVGTEFLNDRGFEKINLESRRSQLGEAYAATDIASFFYGDGEVPSDEVILEDINFLIQGLDSIYLAIENGAVIPGVFEEAQEQLIEDVGKVKTKSTLNSSKRGFHCWRISLLSLFDAGEYIG